jgi:hypothetical protein
MRRESGMRKENVRQRERTTKTDGEKKEREKPIEGKERVHLIVRRRRGCGAIKHHRRVRE